MILKKEKFYMKFRKLILPAILALGAIGGFAAAKASSDQMLRTQAMSSFTGDPDIDVGINVKASAEAIGDWTISTFYIDGLKSGDVSQGDYLSFRLRSNNHGASYFDFIPNINGNACRVPIDPAASGIKFVPAGPAGIAETYNGARTWDLPMNMWKDADVWICIPKTQFTRVYFTAKDATPGLDWTKGLWAVYFMFYGTTNDYVDFDIGDIWTTNIDGDGHLVKINQICDWSSASGNNIVFTENGNKIDVTHNNSSLKPAVRFIRAIEGVDTCDDAACLAAYTANEDAYDDLSAPCLAYLEEAVLGDYADGDTSHAGGKYTGYKAAAKWEAICAAAGVTPSQQVAITHDNKYWMIIVAASATAMVSLGGLFFVLRRRRLAK